MLSCYRVAVDMIDQCSADGSNRSSMQVLCRMASDWRNRWEAGVKDGVRLVLSIMFRQGGCWKKVRH